MALDPRKFTVGNKNCPKSKSEDIKNTNKRKDFFNSIGKVGDIEVLNRFGAGNVTAGLRDLAKTSNSIRIGNTSSAIIPNSNGYVLNAMAINPNEAEKAGQFNPGVLNRATAQADSVLADVKAGKFKLSDIPFVATDFQNLTQLMGGIFTDSSGQSSTRGIELCGASPYAIDLVKYAPKYKFLFIIEITLDPIYSALKESADKLAFIVKTSTRPNVNIEHEEVNMYNFWTRVPKRTVYEPMTMNFYDDNEGIGHLFYTSYLRSISPISRLGGMDRGGELNTDFYEANSMNFNSRLSEGAASISALEGNVPTIIKEIRLFHIYSYGKFMNVYHFYNPKLMAMNLDGLDVAETGGGNEIELQFGYDSLHITPAFSVQQEPDRVTDLTGGAQSVYPIRPNFLDTQEETPLGTFGSDEIPSPQLKNIDKSDVSDVFKGNASLTNIVPAIPPVSVPSTPELPSGTSLPSNFNGSSFS